MRSVFSGSINAIQIQEISDEYSEILRWNWMQPHFFVLDFDLLPHLRAYLLAYVQASQLALWFDLWRLLKQIRTN